MAPMPVTDHELLHPPADLLAFEGIITKITPPNPPKGIPHEAIKAQITITRVFQGDITDKTVTIDYGPCNDPPGKVGDTIPVLANRDKDRFFAPMYWTKGK